MSRPSFDVYRPSAMWMIIFVILELISHSHLQENYTDFIYIYSLHKQCGELYSYIYVFIHTWGVVCVWRRCACADDSATEPSLFVDKRSGGVSRQASRVVFCISVLFCSLLRERRDFARALRPHQTCGRLIQTNHKDFRFLFRLFY